MARDSDYVDYILDCLTAARVGPVTRERLFSGSGLRIDGELFGVILRDTLYFVVDDQTRPKFTAAGMEPFTYSRKTAQRRIERWYELPEDVLLDPGDLRDWVQDALAASRRTAKPAVKKSAARKAAPKKVAAKTPATNKTAAKRPVAKTATAQKNAAKKAMKPASVPGPSGKKKIRPVR
jgi:DNA transformation protein